MAEQERPTRGLVLGLLKRNGKMSVGELSKELGITEMAVRRHVANLERDGLVRGTLVRQAMGRPMQQYALTELAADSFPANYHKFALDLLEELEAEDGELSVSRLFRLRQNKLHRTYSPRMEGRPLEERVAQLAEAQNAAGYMAEWSRTDGEGYVLSEYNCPIAEVAGRFEDACTCELELFRSLLGADVERTECLAKDGGKCVYVIQKRP